MAHDYLWTWDEEDLPEELQELDEEEFEGHKIEYGVWDGGGYGAIDGTEFTIEACLHRGGLAIPDTRTAEDFPVNCDNEELKAVVERWHAKEFADE
jgi:hypothetical protein